MLGYSNETCSLERVIIYFMPKIKDLKFVTEFRLISLCNVIYKLISN